jgi:N-acetylneuraminate lyase
MKGVVFVLLVALVALVLAAYPPRRMDEGEVVRAPSSAFFLSEYVAATITIFNDDLSVNNDAVDAQVQQLADMGIKSVFICGTTGESMLLSVFERKVLAERWRIATLKRHMTLIVHVGTATPVDAVDLATHAAGIGADAIAAMAPFFFKPQSPSDVVDYLAAIASVSHGVPLYYYHIPSMTGVSIPVADILTAGAARVPSLRGAKFSDADLFEFGRCVGLRDANGDPFNLLFGRDEMILGALAIGADGGVGSTYNLPFMRSTYVSLWNAWASGNITQARTQQERSRDIVQLMHVYGGGSLKAMLSLAGVTAGPPRPPVAALSAQQLQQLHTDMIREGFLSTDNVRASQAALAPAFMPLAVSA